jgi:hypothetical protein
MKARRLAALAAAALWISACGGSGDNSTPEQPQRPADAQPEGEFTYRTSGFERLSAVVASQHDYPRTSTVETVPRGCGFSERWEPRPERVAEWRFCVSGARWRLTELIDYHEFFGQPVTQRFACRGPFVPRPPTLQAGFVWTDRCRGAGSHVTVRYEAVTEQQVPVAGKPVSTMLVRARARLRGRIDGVNLLDSWLSTENGLLVKRRVRSDTSIDTPFGKVKDKERYALALRSLTPR